MRSSSLLVVLVLAACATSLTPPSPPRKTNLGLRMIPATLPNGLRAVLVADPNAAEVQVTMRYRVGASDDPPGQEGMAHLVEHLMFQQVLGAQSLFAKLQDTTTSFNGFTTFDATTYLSRAAPARLGELLSIEAVRVGFRCTSITDAVFERERDVVLSELRQREATTELVFALHRALYPEGHPYRRRASVDTVAAITREQACAFADAHYAPSNAVLVVSGPITAEQLDEALAKFLAKIAAREVRSPPVVPAIPAKFRRVDAQAPLDDNAIVIAWPLPQDPALQAAVRAAATRVAFSIQARGLAVQSVPLGDHGAPMWGVFVAVGEDEKRTQEQLLSEIEAAVHAVPASFRIEEPAWLANAALDRLKQSAIYSMFSSLEEGSDRDTAIAAAVLAGRDPNATIAAQAAVLGRLSAKELERLAKAHLRYDQATVAVLTPSAPAKRGTTAVLTRSVHDIGLRRDPPDPAEARRAAGGVAQVQRAVSGMRKRTLPNGLDVVLLPVTSVPTIEIRLVFASGTGDDSDAHRGAARAAANMLEWNPRHLNDFILFAAGGGTADVDVGPDHTAFTARGVDMHLDLLLAGLRRKVRDGIYDADDLRTFREAASRDIDDRTIEDMWRAALFGAAHPYAHVDTVNAALTLDAVKAFRRDHYTPDNATLVIAGRFDAELADRWIDYLFGDWRGSHVTSRRVAPAAQPAAIANDDDVTQIAVAIAMPATRGNRAEKLVAASMLNVIAQDVRHQLAASYTFDASLDEARLASTYVIGGWIDAARGRDAFELLRVRLAALRSDPDAAARTFVTARRHVIQSLLRSTSSAYELAERVQRDIVLERAPLSDARTADVVRRLTIDEVTTILDDFDLSRAVIVLRGPREAIDDAFAALGRTPKRVTAIRDREDPTISSSSTSADGDDFPSELDDPVTLQSTQPGWVLGTYLGYTVGYAADHGAEGYGIAADLGYRFTSRLAAGAHVSIASIHGTYEPPQFAADPIEITIDTTRVGAFLQVFSRDTRLWGSIVVGASSVSVKDNGMSTIDTSLGVGAYGGYDVARFSGHNITVYGRLEADVHSAADYAAFAFGLGYRYH